MGLLQGRTGDWEMVIGLEVHAHVTSQAKLFSGAATAFGAEPNSQVSPIDAAMPGMLPVINRFCVEQAIKTGLGIDGTVNPVSVFDRKNYFYPDLPPGYQISQYKQPIVSGGALEIELEDGTRKTIAITRLHLEQDAGKSLHDQHPSLTYVDLNRAGVALMEIVSEPELASAEEAAAYLRKLRSVLRYLETCDGNMEEGSLRCDANVSVRKPGAALGTRCEIKNLNSIRFVAQAIEYEARRQIELIEDGGTVAQETMLFDSVRGITRPMRSKEEAHDYRYFPDPDLLPLELDPAWIARLRAALPELPDARRARFREQYGLGDQEIDELVADIPLAAYFEETAKASGNAKTSANWVRGELLAALRAGGGEIQTFPVRPKALAELLGLVGEGAVSHTAARTIFEKMIATGEGAGRIADREGLRKVSDDAALEQWIAEVRTENPTEWTRFQAGETKLQKVLVGLVMKKSKGKADPQRVNQLLAGGV
jgi:aspartyl-tRNA(Asn)/glutamyl-tRNA(Gln) amidotransferase subunit B